MTFRNCYEDETRATAYATLEFRNTYHLAFRDLPTIFEQYVRGRKALDFGCGTGRSTRLLRQMGFEVTGVDIAKDMVRKARKLDPSGDYRMVPGDDLSGLEPAGYDLVLSAFTFDNIAAPGAKIGILRDLEGLLKPEGIIVNIVSRPEIYIHEWASFTTEAFPENRHARCGDTVRIIVKDHSDSRPVEDVLWTDEAYRQVFDKARLQLMRKYEPVARGDEPYFWVEELQVAPWAVYVLKKA